MTATNQAASQRWRIRADDMESTYSDAKQCLHQPLPDTAGKGHTDFYQLDQGFSYIETCYRPEKNLAIISRTDNQEPRMVLTLTLKGQSCFKTQSGDDILFSEGYTTITTFNSSVGERLYEGGKETTQLRFVFSQEWVGRHLDEKLSKQLFGKCGIQLVSFRPASMPGLNAAQQLLDRRLDNALSRLYMQGQALTLLASELKPLYQEDCRETGALDLRDMATAQAAREILLREFRTPPSVNELARRVGTNQFKLKQLFHRYLNNTPYGLLLEVRMSRAYGLLETTRCQVGHAADQVGYRHASNFSAAFTDYFGFPPKQLAKNKS